MTSTSKKATEEEPCLPNLTEAEEENYDIDPAKIREEEEECQPSKSKQDGNSAKGC